MEFLCHRLGTTSRAIEIALRKAFNPIWWLWGLRRVLSKWFIVIDKHAIPCKSPDSLHFIVPHVFGTSYNHDLVNVYNFLQTTIHEIDVDTIKLNPRLAELRVDAALSWYWDVVLYLQKPSAMLILWQSTCSWSTDFVEETLFLLRSDWPFTS